MTTIWSASRTVRQAMGDDDGRPAFHQAVQSGLHDLFAFRIESRRRFVEDENPRILQDSPGDGDALALAAGQSAAPVADDGFIAVRQAHDEVMGVGRLGSRYDFVVAGVQPAVKDIFPDRRVEQHRLLRHQADLLAQ